MKTAIVILSLVVLAYADEEVLSDEEKARMKTFQEECTTEEGIDAGVVASMHKEPKDFPGKDVVKCFSKCVLKKYKMIDDDGKFDIAEMVKVFGNEETINSCTKEAAGADACEKAYNVHKCYVDHVHIKE